MKKFLQFAGIISLALAAVALVLMMVTPAAVGTTKLLGTTTTTNLNGINAIFGKSSDLTAAEILWFGNKDGKIALSVTSLIGWILLVGGVIIVLLGVLLPLLKVNALQKFAGLLNLIAVVAFVLAGVFMFLVIPTIYGANGRDVESGASIGAGWVIGGIVAIAAGAVALMPACADFMGKKKGKKRK